MRQIFQDWDGKINLYSSSRDKFEAKSVTEAEDYFVENIKVY